MPTVRVFRFLTLLCCFAAAGIGGEVEQPLRLSGDGIVAWFAVPDLAGAFAHAEATFTACGGDLPPDGGSGDGDGDLVAELGLLDGAFVLLD